MGKNTREQLANLPFEAELLDLFDQIGWKKSVKAGEIVLDPANEAMAMPFVLNGSLKVLRTDQSGNEALLYFLDTGDTCAMSIACCFESSPKAFRVVAEEDTQVFMIPIGDMERWVGKYPRFRRFVFQSYQVRFDELLTTVDSLVFSKMDERVYKYLLDKKQISGSYVISKTHAQIAKELNTSRVVVSRILKQLEKEEKIEQYRNRIELL